MKRSNREFFSFRAIVEVIQEAVVLSNVKFRLMADVIYATGFYLDIGIYNPLLSERSSCQDVVVVFKYGRIDMRKL